MQKKKKKKKIKLSAVSMLQARCIDHCILVDSSAVILDESICHFRAVGSILLLLVYF